MAEQESRVRPGQVYKDNDPRSARRVKVNRAPVQKWTISRGVKAGPLEFAEVIEVHPLDAERTVGSPFYLLLRRMYTDGKPRRSGYSLVQDVPTQEDPR